MTAKRTLKFSKELLYVAFTFAVLGIIVFPFLWVFLISIRPEQELFTRSFQLITDTITFENYKNLLQSGFTKYIVNSLFVSTTATFIAVVLSLLAAYSFSRRNFQARGVMLMMVIFSQLFPYIILITPLYFIFAKLNLVNTYGGLIIGYVAVGIPFAIYMLLGYLNTVPKTLDEAAIIDGCNTFDVIFRIILPIALPGIAATAIYTFIRAWSDYLFALVITSDDNLRTVQIGLANFFGEYTTSWDLVMSASVIATIPTLIVFFFLQRQLVAGLAAGAVKQ